MTDPATGGLRLGPCPRHTGAISRRRRRPQCLADRPGRGTDQARSGAPGARARPVVGGAIVLPVAPAGRPQLREPLSTRSCGAGSPLPPNASARSEPLCVGSTRAATRSRTSLPRPPPPSLPRAGSPLAHDPAVALRLAEHDPALQHRLSSYKVRHAAQKAGLGAPGAPDYHHRVVPPDPGRCARFVPGTARGSATRRPTRQA